MAKKITMTIIPADGAGEIEERTITECPALEELQQLVGGYIELVKVRVAGRATEMICDEDGERKQLTVNNRALDRIEATASYMPTLVGPVVIFSEPVLA
tara:strand:+ start:661 stop:957 length:297 start_codon:yes stop_codon:yes gene_type:complete